MMTDDGAASRNASGARTWRAYRISGRVQGVGFRWWTRQVATELGLVGDVRNRADGTVWVRAGGTPGALDQLARALRDGPPAARVDDVDVTEVEGGAPAAGAFTIERD